MASTPRPWSAEEDRLLTVAVAEYGDEPGMWKSIALRVPTRSNKACRKRWLHSLSPTVKKTPWTPEEDAILLSLYNTHHPPRWSLIAKHISGRTDDACSKRYREALDPNLKRDQWTPDEDSRLLDLRLQLGTKWSQVGHALGRSGLSCRNRFRLLERKQYSRSVPILVSPSLDSSSLFSTCPPTNNSPFGDESNGSHGIDQDFSMGDTTPRPFVHDPPPDHISTSSSLSGALSSAPSASQLPLHPHLNQELHSSHNKHVDDVIGNKSSPPAIVHSRSPSPEILFNDAPPCQTLSNNPDPQTSILTSRRSSPEDTEASQKPCKRPRLCGSASFGQDSPRLSSHLPATMDRTVLPYACGHAVCWSDGVARFATASEVAEHRRLAHPEQETGKLFRCALEGCGKSWKNINGILYHLQISKSHFKTALGQRTSSNSALTQGAAACDFPSKQKEHRCPHEGCPNTYKQRTGLQYHLAHGHPKNIAQLEEVPPRLMRLTRPAPHSVDNGT